MLVLTIFYLLSFGREVDDATAVMAIVMFLFIIPAKPKIWWFRNVGEGGVFLK